MEGSYGLTTITSFLRLVSWATALLPTSRFVVNINASVPASSILGAKCCFMCLWVFNIVGFDYIVNEGDPYNPAYHSYYDPTNSTIHLYYYWEGVGGYRVIWETLSPNI